MQEEVLNQIYDPTAILKGRKIIHHWDAVFEGENDLARVMAN